MAEHFAHICHTSSGPKIECGYPWYGSPSGVIERCAPSSLVVGCFLLVSSSALSDR